MNSHVGTYEKTTRWRSQLRRRLAKGERHIKSGGKSGAGKEGKGKVKRHRNDIQILRGWDRVDVAQNEWDWAGLGMRKSGARNETEGGTEQTLTGVER